MASATVLFYDYLLTLEDEIKYAWSGKKSWIFLLFVINRYFPMTYQFWQLVVFYGPRFDAEVCDKTAFYSIFMAVFCNLLAHVVLTIRVYAISMKNIAVTTCFVIITASNLALGVWMTVLAVQQGAVQLLPVPLDAYRICSFVLHRGIILGYTSIGLLYDFLMFSFIIFLAMRSRTPGLKAPRILGVVADDATRYFLVIFTSHLVLEMTLIFGHEQAIQLLPGAGALVYLPVMVSRIMLSLRKAMDSPQYGWSLAERSRNNGKLESMKFACPRSGLSEREGDIPSNTYAEP